MFSPIEDIHEGDGKVAGRGPTQIPVQGEASLVCRSLGHGQGNPEEGVRSELPLGGCPIQPAQGVVHQGLVKRFQPDNLLGDERVDMRYRLLDPFAPVSLGIAVPKLHGLSLACGCA